MAKKREVTTEFSIGGNTYRKGDVESFSDELAEKYKKNLKPVKQTKKKEK